MPTGEPLIEIQDPILGRVIRPLKWTETAKIVGYRDEDVQTSIKISPTDIWTTLKDTPPKGICRAAITTLFMARLVNTAKTKQKKMKSEDLSSYMSPVVKAFVTTVHAEREDPKALTQVTRWTTIPLPTHKTWVDETADDPNLSLIIDALTLNTQLD